MQAVRLKVRFTGDQYEDGEYPVTPLVQVAFEREFKVGIAKAFSVEQRNEHIYWLAWKAMHAAGRTVPPWGDKFLEVLESVELVSTESPTDATASPT